MKPQQTAGPRQAPSRRPGLFGKRRTIFRSVFTNSLLCIAALLAIAICCIVYFTSRYLTEAQGQSRVELLQQLAGSNAVNRSNMVGMMDALYEDYRDILTAPASAEVNAEIEARVEETAKILRHTGLDFTVDILMNDKREFTTGSVENLHALKSTYWYIKHYAGEVDDSWNLRFLSAQDVSDYGLSYGKTLYDENGRSIGVLIITSAYEVMFRALPQLLDNGSKVYILDQNGILIYHSNPYLIGSWMTGLDAFAAKYGRDSYTLFRRNEERIMLSNYWDEDSGWILVEERNVSQFLSQGLEICQDYLLWVVLASLLVTVYMYLRTKTVTDALAELTLHVSQMPVGHLEPLPVQEKYDELAILSASFNGLISRIDMLIRDIEQREAEKQKTEYDFLQAQINPHFLNNTLLAIKSLLSLNRVSQAGAMMAELIEMLHIPSTPEVQYVPLHEELHLAESFISIMNYRTDKGTVFTADVPESLRNIQVPRLILQPLMGNAFFHGFADREEGCRIALQADLREDILYIEVRDNGDGIPSERLAEISAWDYQSGGTHHGIGLKNVRQRLKLLYGGCSDVEVESREGFGTTVRLILDRRRWSRGKSE